MNTFVFVSIICVGQTCGFMTSADYLTEKECQEYKKDFKETKFKPEVTLAASQCMKFKPEVKV
jgi:hypothetical protein